MRFGVLAYWFSSINHQPLFAHGWTLAFLLNVHRFCGTISRRWGHFLARWLRTGNRGWLVREKILEILYHSWELNPGHREKRQWDTSILPLNYQHIRGNINSCNAGGRVPDKIIIRYCEMCPDTSHLVTGLDNISLGPDRITKSFGNYLPHLKSFSTSAKWFSKLLTALFRHISVCHVAQHTIECHA